jgi:sorbitol-specific phosphotransferase system component IIA
VINFYKLYSLVVLSLIVVTFVPSKLYAAFLVTGLDQYSNTILLGANNVEVEGKLYDVMFVGDTAENLFSENGVYNFAFNTNSEARAASQALLDQVFIGIYDADAGLTAGIHRETDWAQIYTPYSAIIDAYHDGDDRIYHAIAWNASVGSPFWDNDFVDHTWTRASWDYGDNDNHGGSVWAVWTEASGSPVPVPAAVWLLGTGLIGLAGLRRKRKS